MILPTCGYVSAWRMISISVNLRQVLSPNPSAIPSVILPLPTVHLLAFQHENAFACTAADGGLDARVSASTMIFGREVIGTCAPNAWSIVVCTEAADDVRWLRPADAATAAATASAAPSRTRATRRLLPRPVEPRGDGCMRSSFT